MCSKGTRTCIFKLFTLTHQQHFTVRGAADYNLTSGGSQTKGRAPPQGHMINLWDCKMMINKCKCLKRTHLYRTVSNLSSILKTPKQDSRVKSGGDALCGLFFSPITITHNYLFLIVVTHKITNSFTAVHAHLKVRKAQMVSTEQRTALIGFVVFKLVEFVSLLTDCLWNLNCKS